MIIPRNVLRTVTFVIALCVSVTAQQSQTSPTSTTNRTEDQKKTKSSDPDPYSDSRIKKLPSNLVYDQKRIWTGPAHLHASDLKWAIPLVFTSAFAFGIDHAVERKLPSNPNTIKHAGTFSNAGAAALGGIVAIQYFWGIHSNDPKLKETGFLSGEAALDAMGLTILAKGIAQRERPEDGTGQGRFFKSSTPLSSSFPSQHSSTAFAIATVIAQEYPGVLTRTFAYGGAGAIGAARIIGDKHFSSDVLLGAALGYYIGRQVYAGHSADNKIDKSFGKFEKTHEQRQRDSSYMASPYVPLDSWVYPALDRMEAMGLLRKAIFSNRPWTRKQCAQFIYEIGAADQYDGDLQTTVDALRAEFSTELRLLAGDERNLRADVDEVYTRFMGISGPALTDSFHFGQTVYDDFGRPYGQGFNDVTGVAGHAEAGPLGAYVRAEYQHAPSVNAAPLAARNAIATQDQLPVMPGSATPSIDRIRFLDAYLALNVDDWQLSFGKQSLWFGPTTGGSLMYSNNAEPMTMLRLSRVAPLELPSVFRLMGPIATTTFIGQTAGYHFLRIGPTFTLNGSWNTYVNPQPFIWGEQFNIKPTPNLEIGVSLTTVFAGLGRPLTLSTWKHTFSSRGNFQSVEPGDRRTEFNFRYKVPGLRRWLTVYSGSLAEDEPNPLGYPRRSDWSPGLYLTEMPGLHKLDFRIESEYTDIPNLQLTGATYTNSHYANGYTYNGQIIGSWIGPEARAIQLQSNYWFAPEKKLTLGYRMQRVNPAYLSGGDLKDISGQYLFRTRHDLEVTAGMQYEDWMFPLLASGRQHNVMLSLQLRWLNPKEHGKR